MWGFPGCLTSSHSIALLRSDTVGRGECVDWRGLGSCKPDADYAVVPQSELRANHGCRDGSKVAKVTQVMPSPAAGRVPQSPLIRGFCVSLTRASTSPRGHDGRDYCAAGMIMEGPAYLPRYYAVGTLHYGTPTR